MYADRYDRSGIRPVPLGIAIGLNGAVIAALMFVAPEMVKAIDPPFDTVNIPLPIDPPPEPEPLPRPQVEPRTRAVIDPPPPLRPLAQDPIAPTTDGYVVPAGPTGMDGGMTGGTGTVLPEPFVPPHVPVLTGARPDPRFAKAFQPDYPPGERRAGNEGRVTLRVLIGVDGRVKQVERVSAANDAFFEVTRRQALEKWRFTPATRDGIPQEAWREMSVRFELDAEDR